MKTFQDLKVGDYIHIVGYLCGGYLQSLLIDKIEKTEDEDLLISTTDGKQFQVNPNGGHDWDGENFVDVYIYEEDAWEMVTEHDKHYVATQIKID